MFLLTWGFALSGFLLMAILAQMVPLLNAMGIASASVAVAALFGPSQVLDSLCQHGLGSGASPVACHADHGRADAACRAGARILGTFLRRCSDLRIDPWLCVGLEEHRAGHAAACLVRFGWLCDTARQDGGCPTGPGRCCSFVLAFLMQAFGPSTALVVITSTGFLGLLAFVEVARLQDRHRQQASRVFHQLYFGTIMPFQALTGVVDEKEARGFGGLGQPVIYVATAQCPRELTLKMCQRSAINAVEAALDAAFERTIQRKSDGR